MFDKAKQVKHYATVPRLRITEFVNKIADCTLRTII